MQMPVSVLAATIIVLMLMALAAGTLRVRAEPNLAKAGGMRQTLDGDA
jgi:hypothetical protein